MKTTMAPNIRHRKSADNLPTWESESDSVDGKKREKSGLQDEEEGGLGAIRGESASAGRVGEGRRNKMRNKEQGALGHVKYTQRNAPSKRIRQITKSNVEKNS